MLTVLESRSSQQAVPGARTTCTITISNLPDESDYTLVQSLVRGVPIASMRIIKGQHCAHVKLTDVKACRQFLESHRNGIEFEHHGVVHTASVGLSSGEDTRDDVLQAYLECGATRAVQVHGIDTSLNMEDLLKLSSGLAKSRQVESIEDLFRGNIRRVTFRFTGVKDAVAFRADLGSHIGWVDKKAEFVKDLYM